MHRRTGLLVLTPSGRRELRDAWTHIQRQLAAWARELDGKAVATTTRTISEFRQLISAESER